MSDYNFSTLAPNEFEELSKDLVERHLGRPLQAFTTGRDAGIDLRHAPVRGQPWIVQCKHYAGSRFSDLKRSVSREVVKLNRLKPSRYLLATSYGLTPDNVDTLFELLSPYCVSKHDILGKSDLNAILRANGDIERRHPKLWITSEAVLSRVLQNDVFVQSDMTRDSILRRLSLYVYTRRLDEARKKLTGGRVCIISGVPGVGKTTLAEMLLVEHLMDGWQLVTIHQNVSEGLRALQASPDAKQVFYYDDFLGQVSSGEKLGKNEDGALLQLLREIQHSTAKRFVLTTREYILAQAKRQHEKLARANLDIYQFVVECRDYDEEAKARILANHLYFNKVPKKYISAIVRGMGYREIIDHENYNPRLIESMTNRFELARLTPSKYLAAFISRLDDPSQLWEHIYEEQLSEAARHVLLSLAFADAPAPLSTLEQDFDVLFRDRSHLFGWVQRSNDFSRALNELEGNFVRIQKLDGERIVEWHNASVLDFLGSWLRRNRRDVEGLLKSATRFEQIESLINTVPVLIPDEGQVVTSPPDETVLASALRRTLKTVNWTELQIVVGLCDRFSEGEVRAFAMNATERLFEDSDIAVEELPTVFSVFDHLAGCGWVEQSRLAACRSQLKTFLLDLDESSLDRLDLFMPLAQWIADNRSSFSTAEFQSVQGLAARIVKAESGASFHPNMESIWAEMKENVEELQEILSIDFSRDIVTIEGEMERATKPKSGADGIIQQVPRPTKSTIESIFESLLG